MKRPPVCGRDSPAATPVASPTITQCPRPLASFRNNRHIPIIRESSGRGGRRCGSVRCPSPHAIGPVPAILRCKALAPAARSPIAQRFFPLATALDSVCYAAFTAERLAPRFDFPLTICIIILPGRSLSPRSKLPSASLSSSTTESPPRPIRCGLARTGRPQRPRCSSNPRKPHPSATDFRPDHIRKIRKIRKNRTNPFRA